MTWLTIFLAKFLGLYCIVLALARITRRQSAVATINALNRLHALKAIKIHIKTADSVHP